ncbi:transposase [Chromatiales bacterium (ex Bugula neritina AB1)]|nr:transposase [Chromatiales bacterium (ex Bugula neritina AB1)]
MSRFKKLSHTIWHCHYHFVWTPKYRYRVLQGAVKQEAENCIRAFSEQKKCEIVELNVQIDHVHLIVAIPPKLSVSDYAGIVKGRSAIRILGRFKALRRKPYWGNHFWTKGYCVDTVGLDMEKIQAYVKYQDAKDKQYEQRQLCL